jgi:hypothetical protein
VSKLPTPIGSHGARKQQRPTIALSAYRRDNENQLLSLDDNKGKTINNRRRGVSRVKENVNLSKNLPDEIETNSLMERTTRARTLKQRSTPDERTTSSGRAFTNKKAKIESGLLERKNQANQTKNSLKNNRFNELTSSPKLAYQSRETRANEISKESLKLMSKVDNNVVSDSGNDGGTVTCSSTQLSNKSTNRQPAAGGSSDGTGNIFDAVSLISSTSSLIGNDDIVYDDSLQGSFDSDR